MKTASIDTAAVAATPTVAYHQGRSWHFWALVDDELARGELEEASNKLWGAAAHAIKAAAETRGWPHDAHALLEAAVLRLIREESAPPRLFGQYYDGVRLSSPVLRQSAGSRRHPLRQGTYCRIHPHSGKTEVIS